jgi:hypothetical protein
MLLKSGTVSTTAARNVSVSMPRSATVLLQRVTSRAGAPRPPRRWPPAGEAAAALTAGGSGWPASATRQPGSGDCRAGRPLGARHRVAGAARQEARCAAARGAGRSCALARCRIAAMVRQ